MASELTNSASKLTYVNVAFAFPMLSLSLFGGALSDRLDKQKIIQIGQFFAAFLAFIIAALIFSDYINWLHLLTVSFVQGGIWAFMVPSRHAFIAELVPGKNLNSAIALNSAGFNVSNLIAPAVAGLIYGLAGPGYVYTIIGGLALMGFFFTFIIKPEMRQSNDIPDNNQSEKKEILSEIKIGLIYIYNEKLLFSLLIASLIFMLPIFVKDIYLRGPEAMGLLTTLMGLGSVIASIIIAGIDANKRGLIWIIGGFITGGCLLTLAISDSYVISMIVMVFMGASDSIRRTLSMSIMMEKTRPDLRGRIMSIYMLNWGLIPLGALPAGIVADIIGAQSTIGILSILLVISSALVLITQKELRTVN